MVPLPTTLKLYYGRYPHFGVVNAGDLKLLYPSGLELVPIHTVNSSNNSLKTGKRNQLLKFPLRYSDFQTISVHLRPCITTGPRVQCRGFGTSRPVNFNTMYYKYSLGVTSQFILERIQKTHHQLWDTFLESCERLRGKFTLIR